MPSQANFKKYCVFLALLFATANICFGNNIDSLKKIINNSPDDTVKVNRLIQLTEYYYFSDNVREADSAIYVIEELFALSNELNYLRGKARADYMRGKYYIHRNDYAKATEEILNSQEKFQELKDLRGIADCYLQLGLISYLNKNYEQSIVQYKESISGFKKINDSLRAATSIYLLGLTYNETGNYALAESSLGEALKIKIYLKDSEGVTECKMGLGNLAVKQKEYDKAELYFNECNNYFSDQNSKGGLIFTHQGYAAIAEGKGDLENAKTQLLDALSLSMQTENFYQVVNSSESLYKVYQKLGDIEHAFKYQSEFIRYKDSIFSREKSRTIALIESKNNIEKKQTQIDLLSKQRLIDKILRYVLIGGVVIFLFIAGILYNRFQVKQKVNRQLEASNEVLQLTLENLRTTQHQLVQQEKLASLGQMTAGIAHEIQNPLNFVTNFSELGKDMIDDAKSAKSDDERNQILNEIKSNLEKINQHGKRADIIVKGMLMHSRASSAEKQFTDINALCDNTLNLAYNSMRALIPDFTCRVEKSYTADLPKLKIIQQDVSRVVLNLLNNAFYAVREKSRDNKLHSNGWTPLVSITTFVKNNSVAINIRDNGIGISQSILDKIFRPFFTTKPTGEGTGLGLSISFDIVKAHGGEIKAESKEGEGTVFTLILPA